MTQSKEVFNLKRMKYLFGIFLKQFQVDEYKLLMQYLQLTINRYNSNSLNEILGKKHYNHIIFIKWHLNRLPYVLCEKRRYFGLGLDI